MEERRRDLCEVVVVLQAFLMMESSVEVEERAVERERSWERRSSCWNRSEGLRGLSRAGSEAAAFGRKDDAR